MCVRCGTGLIAGCTDPTRHRDSDRSESEAAESSFRLGMSDVGSKRWHNSRGIPWGTTYEGPDPVVVSAQRMPSNITVHLTNEHGANAAAEPVELYHTKHMQLHMLGYFREGQEHYHRRVIGEDELE